MACIHNLHSWFAPWSELHHHTLMEVALKYTLFVLECYYKSQRWSRVVLSLKIAQLAMQLIATEVFR